MRKIKNVILFIGNRRSGKISRTTLKKLQYVRRTGTITHWAKSPESAKKKIEYYSDNAVFVNIYIVLLYCEDTDKNRDFMNIDLAAKVEKWCNEQKDPSKFKIIHRYDTGKIFGNKIETNKFLTSIGVRCPRMVVDKTYNKPVFVNAVNDSRSPEAKVIPNSSYIDETKYNTEFIDTTYEYLGKKYYVNPRVFCLGKTITHFVIKCAPVDKGDVVVRTPWDVTYEEAPGLQYDFFKNEMVPDFSQIQDMCTKIYNKLGFGAYCYDLLKDTTTGKWYMCEAMFKFDSAGSVQRSPYSIITYRKIQKDVFGKDVEKAAEFEKIEKNVPLGVKEWYTGDYVVHVPERKVVKTYWLPMDEYHKIMGTVQYWVIKIFHNYFDKQYEIVKAKAIKDNKLYVE